MRNVEIENVKNNRHREENQIVKGEDQKKEIGGVQHFYRIFH